MDKTIDNIFKELGFDEKFEAERTIIVDYCKAKKELTDKILTLEDKIRDAYIKFLTDKFIAILGTSKSSLIRFKCSVKEGDYIIVTHLICFEILVDSQSRVWYNDGTGNWDPLITASCAELENTYDKFINKSFSIISTDGMTCINSFA